MKLLSALFFFLLMVSCNSGSENIKPEVYIDKEGMIDLIVDVQILESHYHNLYQREDVYANVLDSATFFIFESRQVNKQIFLNNLNYYSLQPDTLFSIYESALDTINNRINSEIQP